MEGDPALRLTGYEASRLQSRLARLGAGEPGSPYMAAIGWRLDEAVCETSLADRLAAVMAGEEGLWTRVELLETGEAALLPGEVGPVRLETITPPGADLDAWIRCQASKLLGRARARGAAVGMGLGRRGRERWLVVAGSALQVDVESLELLLDRVERPSERPVAFPDVAPWLNAHEAPAPLLEDAPLALVDASACAGRPASVAAEIAATAEVVEAAWVFMSLKYGCSAELHEVIDRRETEDLSSAVGPYATASPIELQGLGDADDMDAAALLAALAARPRRLRTALREGRPIPMAVRHHRAATVRQLAGGRAERVAVWDWCERFCLLLCVTPSVVGTSARLVHDTGAIPGARASRLIRELKTLAEAMAADPGGDLGTVRFWDEADARADQRRFNPRRAQPRREPVHRRFAAAAAAAPESTAVEDPGTSLTYRELDAASDLIAEALQNLGSQAGVVVALEIERSCAGLAAILGIWKAGCAYLPLEPDDPPARRSQMVADAGAALAVGLGGSGSNDAGIGRLALDPVTCRPLQASPGGPVQPAVARDTAYLLFTSGSTGSPKAVAVSHRALAGYCDWAAGAYGLESGKGAVVASSLCVDLTVTCLFAPLLVGQRVIMAASQGGLQDLAALLQPDACLSLVKLTPTQLRMLNLLLPGGPPEGSVRSLVLGGEMLAADVLAPWRALVRRPRIWNEYGPTETVVGCASFEIDIQPEASLPIGAACAGASLALLDRSGRLVPAGMQGELLICGPGVAGYHRAPELNALRFVRGQSGGGECYRSGDLARQRHDGALVLEGRTDQQIKLNGRRVEPAEIEQVLRLAPDVADAAVTLSARGTLEAHVEPCSGATLDSEALKAHLRARLPERLTPGVIRVLEALPRTLSGKIDRAALAGRTAAFRSAGDRPAPRTALESVLCRLMAQSTGLAMAGPDDDFVALGGDSMRAMQFIIRAAAEGLELDVRELFQLRTVRRLLAEGAVRPLTASRPSPLAPFALVDASQRERLPIDAEDAYPASKLQLGMIYEHARDGGGDAYHDLFGYRIGLRVDASRLQHAAERLARRHPALRSAFDLAAMPPLAVVRATASQILTIQDLAGSEAGVCEAALDAWIEQERRRGFDLSVPPLLRLHAVICGEDGLLLGVSFHHAAIDGWSDVSLLRELLDDYLALLAGDPPPEAPPPSLGGAFVQLEAEAERSVESRDYWRAKLDGCWSDNEPSGGQAARTLAIAIHPETSEAILRLARRWRLPVKTLLLAAHLRCLCEAMGDPEPVTAAVCGVRPETPGADQVLGLFINTLPVRQRVVGRSWRELAEALLAEELADLPHRRFPLAAIPGPSRRPNSLFYFTDYHNVQDLLARPDLDLELIRAHESTSFALAANFAVEPGSGRLILNLRVRTAWAAALDETYQRVLAALAADPDARFEPPAPAPLMASRFAARVAASPAAIAVGWRELAVSYAELADMAEGVARLMEARGVRPGDRVALALGRDPSMLAAVLACLERGFCFVPVDPLAPRGRIAAILGEARPRMILTGEGGPPLPPTEFAIADVSNARPAASRPPGHVSPASPAYLMFTSGSTGVPKGVLISQASLAALLESIDQLSPADGPPVFLALSSLAFDISLLELLWPLRHGGSVILQEGPGSWFSPRAPSARRPGGPEISLFCFPPTDGGGARRALGLARLADELGLKAIWIPERHFSAIAGDFPNPALLAAAIAASTRRLEVRAGSLVLPLHDPIRAAEDWAQVDILSGGRAGVSFARGWDENAKVLTHGDPDARMASFLDDIALVRRLWRGERARGPGGQEVALPSGGAGRELPCWLSISNDAARWMEAARHGLGVLTHLLAQEPSVLAERIAAYRAEGGRADGVVLMMHASVTRDAREAGEAHAALRGYLELTAGDPSGTTLDADAAQRISGLVDRAMSRFTGDCGLFGSDQACRDRMLALADAGVAEIACLVDFDACEERSAETVRRLAALRSEFAAAPEPRRTHRALSIAENISRFGVTHVQCTPTLAAAILQDPAATAALRGLDVLLVGGEPLSESLAASLGGATDARVLNMYGPTEATIWAVAADVTGFGRNLPQGAIPIGRPLAHMRALILGPDGEPSDEGELCLAGAGLAIGYANDDSLTADRFGLGGGEFRLYRTGDRARRLGTGELQWLGRGDRQVKVGGQRVELGEIEAHALAMPGVAAAAAQIVEGALGLTIAVTPGANLTAERVAAALAEQLPFGIVPGRITVTTNAAASERLSTAGKLLAAPRGGVLERMLGLWRDCLGRPDLGPDDDFFAAGGASIAAVGLMARVEETFGERLPLNILFQEPTASGLARRLSRSSPVAGSTAGSTPQGQATILALGAAQEQIWRSYIIAPESAAFNDAALLAFKGPLSVERLTAALAHLVSRHDALRCRFHDRAGEARQEVSNAAVVVLEHLEAEGLSQAELQERLSEQARRPFDLTSAPPIRFVLAKRGPEWRELLVVTHHVACDGWSLAILVDDFIAAYEALAEGRPPPSDSAPSLASFVNGEGARPTPRHMAALEAYWRGALAGADLELSLPTDRRRGAEPSDQGAAHRFLIPMDVAERIASLARDSGVTEFMVLAAVFSWQLGIYAGAQDVVFGTDAAARPHPFRNLVGSFANRIPLRFDLSGDPTAMDLIDQARHRAPDAYDHQDMPLAELARRLQPGRPANLHPLFQTAMTLQEGSPLHRRVADLDLVQGQLDWGIARLDLELNFQRTVGGLEGVVLYRSDLFEPRIVSSFCASFAALLAEATARPDARLAGLADGRDASILTGRRRAIPEGSVIDLIRASAARRPGATALSGPELSISYGELIQQIEAIAAALAVEGIGPGRTVAVLAERAGLAPLGVLAILRAGGTFLLLGSSTPHARAAQMLAQAKVDALLVDPAHLKSGQALAAGRIPVVRLDQDSTGPSPGEGVPSPVSEPAYICFTSGSTGTPKGAQVHHRGMINHLLAKIELLDLGPEDLMAQTSPETFDVYVWQLLAPLVAGGAVRLYDDEVIRDPFELAQRVAADGATIWEVVPSFLGAVLDSPAVETPRALRRLVVTGEALPPELCRRWLERCPDIPLINAYGPAECSDDVAHQVITVPPPLDAARAPIGRPIANVRLEVRGPGGALSPPGAEGELVIAGVCVGPGYVGDPDRTAEVFAVDPADPDGRLYRTGDRVRLNAGGDLEFLGRSDDQVKLKGVRIELDEVAVAMRRVPGVSDAVAALRVDDGVARLAGYYVPDEDRVMANAERHAAARLAAWESVYDGAAPDPGQGDLFELQTATWTSSYDGERIPRAEMKAWLDATLAQLKALPHRSVLEIGVGSGLVLHGLLADPGTQRYVGLDVSAAALDLARRTAEAGGSTAEVELLRRPAHELGGLPSSSFDLVVLNSTVQYFPSAAYLEQVIGDVAKLVRPGGSIFIGDVRDLRMARAFHLSVLASQSRPDTSAADLRARLAQACEQESELLLEPAFFHRLAGGSPRISTVETRLKATADVNEMTLFRYDVVLGLDGAAGTAAAEADLGPSPSAQAVVLAAARGPVRIRGLANSRLTSAFAALAGLDDAEPHAPLGRIAAAAAQPDRGIDPAAILVLARTGGLDAQCRSGADAERFDLVIFPRGQPPPDPAPRETAGALASSPLSASVHAALELELRESLQRSLPEAMVPSSFTRLAAIPRTAHGKLDRKALPLPSTARPNLARAFEPPAGPVEEALARIWSELLRVDRVGRHDDFFQLGGDSIIAIQLVARARAAGLVLKPSDAFRRHTIAALAQAVAEAGDLQQPDGLGRAPLTPAQRALLDACKEGRNHCNQAVLMRPSRPLDPVRLQAALAAVHDRHEGLRLAVAPGSDHAIVVDAPPPGIEMIGEGAPEALARLQAGLDLGQGRLWRAALLSPPDGGTPALVLVVHHIAVDRLSWEVIIEDLEAALIGLEQGLEPRLRPALPFTRAAQALALKAAAPDARAKTEAWLRQPLGQELPRDLPGAGPGTQAMSDAVAFALDAAATQALRGAARTLNAGLEAVILAAALRALFDWTGRTRLSVVLERSGRDGWEGEADLSRTVGDFTAAWPASFALSDAGDPVTDVLEVMQQLRSGPDPGSFGPLATFAAEPSQLQAMRRLGEAPVGFNFFGELDSPSAGRIFRLEPADLGPLSDPRNPRPRLLQIDAEIAAGRLGVRLDYSRAAHRRRTIQDLGRGMRARLNDLASATDALGSLPAAAYEDAAGLSASELSAAFAETGGA
jgi:amino acid adenylation domain-containing protein/natural product biosynthesis luciferase-like monooxygenase protein/non-ribosomal peptide synthase protein (TIGR01720 family)